MLGEINFDNINLRNGAYDLGKAYNQNKLANILFTRELAKRLGKDSNINTYCLHPGITKTDLLRYSDFKRKADLLGNIFFLNVEQGCRTTVYCAVDESLDKESGFYYTYVIIHLYTLYKHNYNFLNF